MCRTKVLENLSKLQHVPSVQFSERPPETELHENVCVLLFDRLNSCVEWGLGGTSRAFVPPYCPLMN